jgi:predicted DNA-binding transcriptional regulator AlpA
MDRTTAPLPKKYLSEKEVCTYTTLSRPKILEARDMRQLKYRTIGGRIVYEIAHVDQWIESIELKNSKPTYKSKK